MELEHEEEIGAPTRYLKNKGALIRRLGRLSQDMATRVEMQVETINSRMDGTTREAWETCQGAGGKKLTCYSRRRQRVGK